MIFDEYLALQESYMTGDISYEQLLERVGSLVQDATDNGRLYFEYAYLYGSEEGKRRFLEDGHSD